MVNRPTRMLDPPPGGRVVRSPDQWTSVVDVGDGRGRALAMSEVPLRRGGEPVDTSLQREGAGWGPENALAGSLLPDSLSEGFELLRSGLGVVPLRVDGSTAEAQGVRTARRSSSTMRSPIPM